MSTHETMDHTSASLRRAHHEISTSSDEMRDNGSTTDSATEWSVTRKNRRLIKKRSVEHHSADFIPLSPVTSVAPTISANPFSCLPVDIPATTTDDQPIQTTPPPIHIKTISNYTLLRADLNRLLGPDNYMTKSTMTGMTLRAKTSTAYRTAVNYLREKAADFHTYQNPTDRPFRIAIRHLNPTTSPTDISSALEGLGHRVRNVHNAVHPRLKVPLALFFVDLEPDKNNKNIFGLTELLNSTISVEEPYKRTEIPQCTRCQEYHHTKTYCNHPARCVKCGGAHETTACRKTRDTPATCALCKGPHPASYKGCQVYQDLQRKRRHTTHSNKTEQPLSRPHHPPNVNIHNFPSIVNTPPPPSQPVYNHPSRVNSPTMSYAQVTALTDTRTEPQQLPSPDQTNLTTQLTTFLTEFKNMITPLITLLTTVITKLITP